MNTPFANPSTPSRSIALRSFFTLALTIVSLSAWCATDRPAEYAAITWSADGSLMSYV